MARKILLVDDSKTVRSYHRKILEESGFEVEEAVNGWDALEKAIDGEFSLFLVDINMPRGTGLDFIRELRSRPELAVVPAVVISTESAPDDIRLSLSAGANMHLIKPVSPKLLREVCIILSGGLSNNG